MVVVMAVVVGEVEMKTIENLEEEIRDLSCLPH